LRPTTDRQSITAIKGTFRRRICWVSTLSPPGSLSFCQTLKKNASAIFQDLETQFKFEALGLWISASGAEQQFRVRQTQPLLWIIVQISRDLGSILEEFTFYEHSGFYRIL